MISLRNLRLPPHSDQTARIEPHQTVSVRPRGDVEDGMKAEEIADWAKDHMLELLMEPIPQKKVFGSPGSTHNADSCRWWQVVLIQRLKIDPLSPYLCIDSSSMPIGALCDSTSYLEPKIRLNSATGVRSCAQTPVRSGLPPGPRGVGADRFGVPSFRSGARHSIVEPLRVRPADQQVGRAWQ